MDKTVMNKIKNKKEQRKKQESTFFPFFFLHFSFLICLILCSCDTHGSSQPSNYKSFEYKLRGTWESKDTDIYSGTLVIDSDSITIGGYTEGQTGNQTEEPKDDSKRPFKGFNLDAPMRGYSQDGKIYFEHPTGKQNEFPYEYSELGDYPNKQKFLNFTFGTRTETLKQTKEY